jgi:DNA-binding NtrC family response regulator
MGKTILFVEDEQVARVFLARLLRREGFEVLEANDLAEAREVMGAHWVDMIILDRGLPDGDGLSFLREIRQRDPYIPVTVLTAHSEPPKIVEAMNLNAVDYVVKPVDMEGLMARVRTMSALDDMRRQLEHLSEQTRVGTHEFIAGNTPAMRRVVDDVEKVSPTNATVLITGESGTGKEVIAQLIHSNSLRRHKVFLPVNCAAVPDGLVENDLFGHEGRAYTDAGSQPKKGLFEAADGGTLFLDEIGNMGSDMQSKLLRAIEERAIRRVGGTRDIPVDIRLITATRVDLEQAVADGRFREDLYYRLSVVVIWLPPLRERATDIPQLAAVALQRKNREMGKSIAGFSAAAMNALQAYKWPGNIRELNNAIESACVFCSGDQIELTHLPYRILA